MSNNILLSQDLKEKLNVAGSKNFTYYTCNPQEIDAVKDYVKKIGGNVQDAHAGKAEDLVEQLEPSDKRYRITLHNSGNLKSQRPSFINSIKQKRPNAQIIVDFMDFFTHGQFDERVREELAYEYGIGREEEVSIRRVLKIFRKKVPYKLDIHQYAKFPRACFWIIID